MPSSEELQRSYSPEALNQVSKRFEGLAAATRKFNTAMQVDPYNKVREFHEAMGQPVGDKPQFLTEDRFSLRKKLIEEEYQEFLDAVEEGDLVNAFKELADLIYVVEGTAVEMGGNLSTVFSEVHDSNMSKLDDDGKPIFREDGKVLKGENYREPDIASALGL